MVLSDVNGNGKKSAAERWLRQRNGQRSTAVRCIFGPPEKRGHMMVLMRNEAEMDRKRAEFVARYEPVGLTAGERRAFYDGLVRTSSSTSPGTSQQRGHQQNNGKWDLRGKRLKKPPGTETSGRFYGFATARERLATYVRDFHATSENTCFFGSTTTHLLTGTPGPGKSPSFARVRLAVEVFVRADRVGRAQKNFPDGTSC